MSILDEAKALLPRHPVYYYEFLSGQIKTTIKTLEDSQLTMREEISKETLTTRLQKYEESILGVCRVQAVLAYWGNQAQSHLIPLASKRIGEMNKPGEGYDQWIRFRWYPILLIIYSSGIASVAAENYVTLNKMFAAKIEQEYESLTLIRKVNKETGDFNNLFRLLPDRERERVPKSEYIFALLKSLFEEIFFLGEDYEVFFDKFELLFSLEYANHSATENGRIWGPIGRFGYKFHNSQSSPFHRLSADADTMKEAWPPLKAGLFNGSYDRFKEIETAFRGILNRLP